MTLKSPYRGIQAWRKRHDALYGGRSYVSKVLGFGPIAYWPLWEANGTVAHCLVNAAQNGTYSSDVSTWPVGAGIGDGNSAPYFDGTNDYVHVYSATLNGLFSASAGTLHGWMKVSGGGDWTDGTIRNLVCFWRDWDNYVRIVKSSTNNQMIWHYEGNNNPTTVTVNGYSFTDWAPIGITWDVSANQTIGYLYGSPVAAAATGLANWVGGLITDNTMIGSRATTPNEPWKGQSAQWAYWTTALSATTMADLAAA